MTAATARLIRRPIRGHGAYKFVIDDSNLTAVRATWEKLLIDGGKRVDRVACANRFFLCWHKRAKYKFEFKGILLGDESGYLRQVPSFDFLFDKLSTPYRVWHFPIARELKLFEFEFDDFYYLIPFPAELFLSESLGNPAYIQNPKQYYQQLVEKDYPPEPCFEDENWDGNEEAFQFGTFFQVKDFMAHHGLPVKTTFMEWLGLIHYLVYLANAEKKFFDTVSNHHTESYGLLKFVQMTLETMTRHPDVEDGYEPRHYQFHAMDLSNAIKVTENLAQHIHDNYLESGDCKRRFENYTRKAEQCCDDLISIFKSEDFLAACREVKEEEPYHDWLKQNGFADLITDALTLIAYHPDEFKRDMFYRQEILPTELRLAYKLDANQLEMIKTLLAPEVLKAMLPHRSDREISTYYNEICSNLYGDIIGSSEVEEFFETFLVNPEKMSVTNGTSVIHNLLAGHIGSLWNNQWGPPSYIGHIIECFSGSFEKFAADQPDKKRAAMMLVFRIRTSIAVSTSNLRVWNDGGFMINVNTNRMKQIVRVERVTRYDYTTFKSTAQSKGGTFGKWVSEKLFGPDGWRTRKGQKLVLKSEAPAAINLFCSAVSLYVAVRDTMTTVENIKNSKDGMTAEHMLQLYQAFTAGGFAVTGLLPSQWLNTVLGQNVNNYLVKGAIIPANFAIRLFTHADRCKTEFSQGEYDLAILNGFQTALFAYGLWNVSKLALFNLAKSKTIVGNISRKILFTAFKRTLKSQIRSAATKKSGVILIDIALSGVFLAQDVSNAIRNIKYKPLGLCTEFTDMLEKKFEKDTVEEIEGRKIRIPRYGKDIKVELPPSGKEFNWLQIRDCLQGKPVAGLVMNNLAFWNIHPEKGRDELIDKGIPLAYVAYLCKLNKDELEREKTDGLDAATNKSRAIFEKVTLASDRNIAAQKWLIENGVFESEA